MQEKLPGSRIIGNWGLLLLFWAGVSMLVVSCGDTGPAGPEGSDGSDGADGVAEDGITGDTGLGVLITERHGTEMLLSTGEFATADKRLVTATVTSATANVGGVVTVSFTVDDDGTPVVDVPAGECSFAIVKLVPAPTPGATTVSYNKWVSYLYNTATVAASGYTVTPPNAAGTVREQAYREEAVTGTFANYGDGSYSYVFATDISSVTTPVSSVAITYDRSLVHRVSVMIGGHAGPTADANFDFVPDGSVNTETRDIVQTATCAKCHGVEFHGHGGDRLTMENCVTCHNAAGGFDPESDAWMDMTAMIHKIHAGGELASIDPSGNGVFDDPFTTGIDESADNGEYAWWGYRGTRHSWEKTSFPAVLANCTACHEGSGADVDNWASVPSRDACGSCHDDVDFVAGTNHQGGVAANDSGCAGCHQPVVTVGVNTSVTDAHDWTVKTAHHIAEFQVDITVSAPGNGTHFVDGESPVVTLKLYHDDDGDGVYAAADIIDHTTFDEDDTPEPRTDARDGLFEAAAFYVHGPRAKFNPVLTMQARCEVVASGAGSFDLTGAGSGETLDLVVDGGKDLLTGGPGNYDDGNLVDNMLPANISVAVDDGTWGGGVAAATAAEIITWLNADAYFAGRCIAYTDEKTGFLAVRSRNLGDVYSLELKPCLVTTQVFGGDVDLHKVGRSNNISERIVLDDDPKVTWTAGAITYDLDPVDDLQPGTYVVSCEISDRGRPDRATYWTPSVASATFQVGMATDELPVARNCGACHESTPGRGFVLDFYRHHKKFGDYAVDMCAACHDYQPGGSAISDRTHAVHNGANLNYPNVTVGHEDMVKGRNWDIEFPQDIRNCEACHTSTGTSGSWMAGAARLPCQGCHDSDAVDAHMLLQTYDPTPADPWSGDEKESCKICH